MLLKSAKAILLLVSLLVISISKSPGQGKLKTRAGFIGFEDRGAKKRDFSKVSMNHVAVLYLPDSLFGFYKTALTVFGNDKATYPVPKPFTKYADSLIKDKFEALTMTRFTAIYKYPTPEQYPFLKGVGFKTVVTEGAKKFFEELHQQGFEGLFVLAETMTPNLISGHAQNGPLHSKGIYQYLSHQYIYHSIAASLFDLRNGTQVEHVGYLQFSGDDYPGKEVPKPPLTPYMDMLLERLRNNVEQILLVNKMY